MGRVVNSDTAFSKCHCILLPSKAERLPEKAVEVWHEVGKEFGDGKLESQLTEDLMDKYDVRLDISDPKNILCYSPGIKGALSNYQDLYCPEEATTYALPSELYKEHIEEFANLSQECKIGGSYEKETKSGTKTFQIRNIRNRAECLIEKLS